MVVGSTLEFNDLTVDVVVRHGRCCKTEGDTKRILDGVTGKIFPGDLVALMGASGAGKSTLLNVLSRRNTNNGGEVLVNGEQADSSPIMKFNSCYIQQEDLFYTTLTVHEHLISQAALRLAVPKKARSVRVEDVINIFGMNKTRDSEIGGVKAGGKKGISGGEMKRLSVASELLANPTLIFADEPTSGLDASMAETVVEVLADLAKQGHTVICTIHQPSSGVFRLFNKLILLSEGKMLFNGPRLAADVYMSRVGIICPAFQNPADYYLEALAIDWEHPDAKLEQLKGLHDNWKDKGDALLDEWANQGLKEKMEAIDAENHQHCELAETPPHFDVPTNADGSPKRPPVLRKLRVLINRAWIQMLRHPALLLSTLATALVTSTVGGIIYWRIEDEEWYSKTGATFFLLINQAFPALNMVLLSLLEAKPIARREKESGLYNAFMAFWVQALLDSSRLVLNSFLFATICWWTMGLRDEFVAYLEGFLIIGCVSFAMSGYGYIVGASAPSSGVAFALGPLIVLPMMFTSGFMVSLDALPTFWIWLVYISPVQYGFSGILQIVYAGQVFCENPEGAEICTGDEVVALFTSGIEYWYCVIALLTIGFVTRCVGCVALMIVFRHKENH